LAGGSFTFSSDRNGDFRSYTDNTVFRIAYYAPSGITNISIRFKSTDSDYRQYSFSPTGNGAYTVRSWKLQDFQLIGNPSWNEFYKIEVIVSGTGRVTLDAITSIEENLNDILVSRAIFTINNQNFVVKNPLKELQIEYTVDLNG
jgi:hypothetical protein